MATVAKPPTPLHVRGAPEPLQGGPLGLLRFLRSHGMLNHKYARLLARWAWLKLRWGGRLQTDGICFVGPGVKLEIGRDAVLRLGRWSWIGHGTKIRVHEGEVEIGAKTVFGQECTISAFQHVSVGRECIVADRVMMIDFDHGVVETERPIRLQGIYKRDVQRRPQLLDRLRRLHPARRHGRRQRDHRDLDGRHQGRARTTRSSPAPPPVCCGCAPSPRRCAGTSHAPASRVAAPLDRPAGTGLRLTGQEWSIDEELIMSGRDRTAGDQGLAELRLDEPTRPERWSRRVRWAFSGCRHDPRPSRLGTLETPDPDAVGICCSGGGIRSAAFNLGALQALQQRSILQDAKYLAAVSGGSYIAAAFCMVAKRDDPAADDSDPRAFDDAHPPFHPGSPEEQYLRNRSSYLAPDGLSKLFLAYRVLLGLVFNLLFLGCALVAIGIALGTFVYRPLYGSLADPAVRCPERTGAVCGFAADVPEGFKLALLFLGIAILVNGLAPVAAAAAEGLLAPRLRDVGHAADPAWRRRSPWSSS